MEITSNIKNNKKMNLKSLRKTSEIIYVFWLLYLSIDFTYNLFNKTISELFYTFLYMSLGIMVIFHALFIYFWYKENYLNKILVRNKILMIIFAFIFVCILLNIVLFFSVNYYFGSFIYALFGTLILTPICLMFLVKLKKVKYSKFNRKKQYIFMLAGMLFLIIKNGILFFSFAIPLYKPIGIKGDIILALLNFMPLLFFIIAFIIYMIDNKFLKKNKRNYI